LAQAQVTITQTKLAQQTAELALVKTQDTRSALELALFNAQVNRKTAEVALSRTEETAPAPDIVAAKAAVDRAQTYLQYALDSRSNARDTSVWDKVVERAQIDVDVAQQELDRLTAGSDPDDIAIKKMQLESSEKAVIQAQKTLDELTRDIAMQEVQIASAKEVALQAERSAELAQLMLDQTQKRLNEVTIVAPWNGLVISVDAREGDMVAPPAAGARPVIYLLDPSSMEVNAEIDEIDIAGVKLNQKAVISLDAAPGAPFSGKVTHISMVPIQKQAGVVAYEVKIGIDAPPEMQLRVGMSATVDIVVNERQNVLLIPNRAIKYDSLKKPFVEVTVDEQIKQLPIVLGMTDGVNTEVVSGLESGTLIVAATAAGKKG
ncbi:MAG: efflux RND transporter periplasmic adaptor subunit, partial [Dehalococcoidales bacterium]|nr:efflux RND transporter periplasmic adaptor subunit [Dehalococcoidales bacterium]